MQIYSYRGVVQHHGIVVWTPPAELARELTVQELRLAVKVVHFDPSRDGVITTPLQVFLEVKLLTARHRLEGGPFCRVTRKDLGRSPPMPLRPVCHRIVFRQGGRASTSSVKVAVARVHGV